MKCNYLLPRNPPFYFDESVECLLRGLHTGEHLVLLPHGRYMLWELEDDCGCIDETRNGDYCGCFLYRYISNEEANKILGNNTAA